jgi:AraC-like DNA-binding protein
MIRQINVKNPSGKTAEANPSSTVLPSPGQLAVKYQAGRGSTVFSDYKIKPDLLLTVSDIRQSQKLKIVYETENAPITFGFNMCHRIRGTIHAGGKRAQTFERQPGGCTLSYLPQTRCVIETPPEDHILGVSVHFSPERFKNLFRQTPEGLEDMFSRSGNRPFVYRQSLFSSQTANVLNQITHCPYTGEVQRLFLEAKALELVALNLYGMNPVGTSEPNRRETEQIHQAYEILVQRIDAPPTLCQLSRAAGINRNRLNHGFKRIYGGTVFNVLRDLRLYRARDLLLNSTKSLADIALSVGYSDQANFTTAFRQRFGKTPLTIRRDSKSSI